MLDERTYKETFSHLHASDDTVTEVLKMAQKYKHTPARKTGRRAISALIAAACVLILSVTAYAVGAHTGFFESVFGTSGANSYEAYEQIADDTKPNSGMITVPAYERVEVDEDTAEALVGQQIQEVNESFTLLGTTVTAESLLMDENGIGVLAFTISNPDGFPNLEKISDAHSSEVWNIITMDEEDGWVGSSPLISANDGTNFIAAPYMYLDSARSTDTVKYVTAYFYLPTITAETDLVTVGWNWYEYNGEYEYGLFGDALPAVDEHKEHITLPLGNFVPAQTFRAENGITATVSPLGVVLGGSFDGLKELVLDYADGTSYTVIGEDVRNVQFANLIGPDAFGIYGENRTDLTYADMGKTTYAFNRLVEPENVVAVRTSGGYSYSNANGFPEEHPDMTFTK